MARSATSRLKVNPPLGRMPVLQFLAPAELTIDASYQRSIESGESKALIRKIAQHWNWDLCLPLVVSRRREDGVETYYVIDGQHRLDAARMRKDIAQLPCMVKEYASAADEAASFVHLNQQRRPLGALDLFKAALASEDPEAVSIMKAMGDAGLSLAAHSNYTAWKPGQLAIIGGIQREWRRAGAKVTAEALQLLGTAFPDAIHRYAGTIWPGLVAVCAEEMRGGKEFDPGRFATLSAKLGSKGQNTLRKLVLARCALKPELGRNAAAIQIVGEVHWPERKAARVEKLGERSPLHFETDQPVAMGGDGKAWCDQCEMRVTQGQAEGCKSRWCSLRKVA